MLKKLTSKASFGCPKWKCIIPKHNKAISYLPKLLAPAGGTKSNPSVPALLSSKQQISSVLDDYAVSFLLESGPKSTPKASSMDGSFPRLYKDYFGRIPN